MRYFSLSLLLVLSHFILHGQDKVGIGTDSPQAKLDIVGVGDGIELLRFSTDRPWVFKQRSSGSSTRLSLQSTTNDKIFEILSEDGTNRAVEFFSNNVHSNVLLVPDAGEVGIGLADPLAKLHVVHNSNIGWPNFRVTEIGYDFARIKLETGAMPGTFWDIAGRSDSLPELGRLNFYYSSPNGTGDRMTITGAGNVGIGTTNPQAKLDIIGGDWNLGAGNPGDLRIGNSTYNFRVGVATGGGGAGTTRLYSQGGDLKLGTNNTNHLNISTNGNVAIGSDPTGNKFRVLGSATSPANVLSVSSSYSGNSNIRAVEGFSFPATGYGYGGYFAGGLIGAYGYGNGGSFSGTAYGLYGISQGSAGTRIGVYGNASGGVTNWAGYFSAGNVYIQNDLRIGSGAITGATGYKVAIDGKVVAEEMRVQLSGAWPDYVFEEDYAHLPLSDLSAFVKQNKHLPGVPSAQEVDENGLYLGEMQRVLLEKIEEMTLHILELNERIDQLENRDH